jgi:L-rhamnose mutarotase
MMDITLTMDETILSLGMEYAKEHNMLFNELVAKSLEQTVKHSIEANAFLAPCGFVATFNPSSKQWWDETLKLMEQAHGNSHGKKWTREELYRG